MDESWIKSPNGRRVLVHWADTRPAWLWSHDGETLLWRNAAARLFQGRIKKHGLKLAPDAVPIKGQVARLLRLGTPGRSSLSRIQFLAGDKPLSRTCTVTPLYLADHSPALLIVGVDAIDPDLRDADGPPVADAPMTSILPAGSDFVVTDRDGALLSGTSAGRDLHDRLVAQGGVAANDTSALVHDGEPVVVTRFTADAQGASLLLFEATDGSGQPGPSHDIVPDHIQPNPEPELPLGIGDEPGPTEAGQPDPAESDDQPWVVPPPVPAEVQGTLASLFDRLAEDQDLYGPLEQDELDAATDDMAPTPSVAGPGDIATIRADEGVDDPDVVPPVDAIAELIDAAEAESFGEDADTLPEAPTPQAATAAEIAHSADMQQQAAPSAAPPAPEPTPVTTWRIIGRGFAPAPNVTEPAALPQSDPGPLPDAETVERVSRYNFDELTRILTDRVSAPATVPPPATDRTPASGADGALVSLAGETLILNRLPIGILVFRDQQVLFANRSLIDLIGYESIEGLRKIGLPAIFPTEETVAGPVTQLVRRDGHLVPVNARLQSISWHSRPALMLSATAAETRLGHEGAVRNFAELAAQTADEGFLTADRSGVVSLITLHGRILLGLTDSEATGRPLSALIDPAARSELSDFLEKPARFAETARPSAILATAVPSVELVLFAEGQAGIVAGYFGFVRKRAAAKAEPPPQPADDGIEPSILARISRGIRRPLNTVIGFADIMHGTEPGGLEVSRYSEYARDIKTAGEEIATLVGELDDYSRLREGRYPLQVDELDLGALLDTCLVRVRGQASAARVLVRSAVSERLPRIAADRASLTQAVLNLLASAIDQTPAGGSVILSAQRDDTGGIVINVRDNGDPRRDLGERFVVFRDGIGRDGEQLGPVRSSVGLALTRSLLAVNALRLSVDPMATAGTRFSMLVPPDLIRG